MSYLVGNPEHRFSHGVAHIIKYTVFCLLPNDPFSYGGEVGGHLMHFSRDQEKMLAMIQ